MSMVRQRAPAHLPSLRSQGRGRGDHVSHARGLRVSRDL